MVVTLHPWTLAFDDAALEITFTTETFIASAVVVYALFGAMILCNCLMALHFVHEGLDPLTPMIAILQFLIMIALRYALAQVADQRRTRKWAARGMLFVNVIFWPFHLGYLYSHPFARAAKAMAFVLSGMWSVIVLYLRAFTAMDCPLHEIMLTTNMLGVIVHPTWTELGRPTEVWIVLAGFVLGEAVGYLIEGRKRHAFLALQKQADVTAAPPPAKLAHQDTAPASTSGSTVEIAWTWSLSLAFNDAALEREYATKRFVETCDNLIAFGCLLGVVQLGLLFFVRGPLAGALAAGGLCTAVLVAARYWLHKYIADQSRARMLFARVWLCNLVFAFHLSTVAILHYYPPEPNASALVFTVGVLMLCPLQFLFRIIAMPDAYRHAHTAANLLLAMWLPPLSVLGRPAEPFLMVAMCIFGELFGVTIEKSLREIYAHAELARRRASRAAQKTEEVAGRVTEEVAGYVFHELRNDTNASVGVLECIVEAVEAGTATLPAELRQMVLDSRVHARHAMQVINNILDFSKIKAGAFELKEEPFELRSIVDETVAMVRHLLHSKPEVVLNVDAPRDLRLRGSPFHLQQVLLNLLSNACKCTAKGTISLTIEEGTADDEPRALTFRVADTGPGVPPSQASLIFQEWHSDQQGGGANLLAGSGLGLPLCQAILRQMGSTLELTAPAEGTGAIFSFELALPRAGTPTPPATRTPVAADDFLLVSSDAPMRLLIADDQKMNRLLLKLQLGKIFASTEFVEVETGEEALAALLGEGGEGFDIAFIDEIYGAHPLRGAEVTRRVRQAGIRARGPGNRRLPIVGITGNAGGRHNEAALASGQDAIWGKPTPKPVEMREQLSELLGFTSETQRVGRLKGD